ncbi:MAG: hypothetical protein ABSC55_08745 [Syntrophorhabdales bacterium]|jgi:hypothetical protein
MNRSKQVPENLDDFLKAFAEAFLAWQGVESNLFLIYNFLVGPDPNPALLSAKYNSVWPLNSHRKMVDDAAADVLKNNKCSLKEWEGLSRKISDGADRRNKLAHFELAYHTDADGKTKALLRPSIFKSKIKTNKKYEEYEEYDIKQIREWEMSFHSIADGLSRFLNDLPAARRLARAQDAEVSCQTP